MALALTPAAFLTVVNFETRLDGFQTIHLATDVLFVHLPAVLAVSASVAAANGAADRLAGRAGGPGPGRGRLRRLSHRAHATGNTHLEIRSPKLQRPVRIVVLADVQMEQFGSSERRCSRRPCTSSPT